MKKYLLRQHLNTKLSLFICMFLVLFSACADNLIQNPSFETMSGNYPAGWIRYMSNLTTDTSVKYSDTRSGRIDACGGGGQPCYYQRFACAPGDRFDFSVYIKTSTNCTTRGLVIQFLNAQGNYMAGPSYIANTSPGDNDWWQYKSRITAPVQAATIEVALTGVYGTGIGVVWFDDITLEKLPSLVTIPSDRKIIAFGNLIPSDMRSNIIEYDDKGFDGVTICPNPRGVNFSQTCWGATTFTYSDFTQNIADIQYVNTNSQRLIENFPLFGVSVWTDVDWFNDTAFNNVLNNAEMAGRFANDTGCPGIFFDVEPYGSVLWNYQNMHDKFSDSYTLSDYQAKVYQRGQEMMQKFNLWYPGITIILTYGYGMTPNANFALLKYFLDGMLNAADADTTIVDGYEFSYAFRNHFLFEYYQHKIYTGDVAYAADAQAYRQHIKAGFGIYADDQDYGNGWDTANFYNNYYLPPELEYSLFCGLDLTDKYVWVFSLTANWWTGANIPSAYSAALSNARNSRYINDAEFNTGHTNLKGWWRLEETGSTTIAHDSSGCGNNGTLYSFSSPPAWVNGKFGGALSFDGSNDYVTVNNVAVDTMSGHKNTVAFWMKWNGTSGQVPFSWLGYNLYLINGKFSINTGCGDLLGIPASGLTDRWVHVAVVFPNAAPSTSNANIYIDGISQTLTLYQGVPTSRTAASTMRIGSGSTSGFFGGTIDDMRVYNCELSAATIAALAAQSNHP